MKLSNEMKIGIMVVVVLIMLGYITFRAGEFDFKKKRYDIKVHFYNIEGIAKNAPVMFNGFEIGAVKEVNIIYGEETIMECVLSLDESVKLKEGATALVKNMGFMGEKYIGLTSGQKGAKFLPPGSIINGKEPGSLEAILSDGEVIAANLKNISAKINERIEPITLNLDTTMKNLTSITDNINERLTVNEHLIDEFVLNLNDASKNLDELSYDLKLNPWKLMYRKKEKKQ